jgi:outer membrane protein assembly factor BamB
MAETLEDHLRRVTRNFTAPLPEPQLLTLGCDLARELARAHAEASPRHPEVNLATITLVDGKLQMPGGDATGTVAEDLFELGALLLSVAAAAPADVSWRLDGPPAAQGSTLAVRAILTALASPRRERRFATAAEAVKALEATLSAAPLGAPWPLFRGEAGRRGSAEGEAPSALTGAWDVAVGSVVGSPVLTTGLAIAPTADGRLVFLDAGSGRLVHELKLASTIESSPALAAGLLYVGSDDGECVAVDVESGEVRYRARLGQLVRSSPLPVGERVVVGVVEPKGAGSLVALDAKGKLAWRAKLAGVFSSPALAGPHVLVGSDDGSLHAVDHEKGSLAWSHAVGSKVRATPAIAGEVAIVGDFSGRLVAVWLKDGSRAWTAELGSALYSSAAIAAEVAVVGSNDGTIHGVDLKTGAVRFQVRTRGPVVASPLSIGERFVVGSTDGDLYLIDATGKLIQQMTLAPGGIASSAAAASGLLVVGSARGLHGVRLT